MRVKPAAGEQCARGRVQGGHWDGFGRAVEDPVAEPADGLQHLPDDRA
jgi:hypothetical protein